MNSLILLLAITTAPSTFPAIMPTTEATTAPTTGPTTGPATEPTTVATNAPGTAPAVAHSAPTVAPMSVAHPSAPVPVNPLIPRPMPNEYSLLLNRSMFVRGHVAFDTHLRGTPPPPRIAATEPSLARPETTLVFNGVTVANGAPVAFIEDTANQKVLTVQVGQSIAQGQITDITLDSMSYRNSTRTVVLQIGQDLSGNDAVPSLDTPTTVPAESASDITTGGDSILERMKRKRALELQGK